MRRDELYLRDVIEAAGHIAEDTAGMGLADFLANRTVRDAVVRNLTVIGEACSRVSPSLRERHSDVPWADIVAFRNILVHAYFGIDWNIVWRAAARQVPDLASRIETVLQAEFGAEV
jgi:uncharacterized protein with HEPN domain